MIECAHKPDNEKCFDMLEKWVEVDVNASYRKLINALHRHNLNDAAERVKDEVYKL